MNLAERANPLALSLPNVTTMDFFLFGLRKDPCTRPKVGSEVELRARSSIAVGSVTLQMLVNTWREIEYRSDISELTLRSTEHDDLLF
jgi:hypothetical protein